MCRPCVRRGGLQDSGFVACFPSPPRRARLRYVVPGGTGAFVRVGVQWKDAKLGHPTASSQHKRTPPPRQRKAGWATLSCKLIRINELTGWATRLPGRGRSHRLASNRWTRTWAPGDCAPVPFVLSNRASRESNTGIASLGESPSVRHI